MVNNAPHSSDTPTGQGHSIACIRSMDEYDVLYRRSLQDAESFWEEQARTYLSWEKEWDSALCYDFDAARVEWFRGGVINASYNCVDRHLDRLKNKIAYYCEGDDPSQSAMVTFSDLHIQVNRFAAGLRSVGVGKGDRVVAYMPMIVELPVVMLACARLGATHCVVFGGYGPEALAIRVQDCRPKVVVTVDVGSRAGKTIQYGKNVAEALRICPEVERVIVIDRSGKRSDLDDARQLWWHDICADGSLADYVPPEPMESEDPLFILYTSGSSNKPLGIVHTHGGYLLHAAMATSVVFGIKEHETLWSTPDIGWIGGHTYSVYGSLLNGFSSVLFEGMPLYPQYDRYWQIVSKYRVNALCTAPTVIRRLAAEGPEHLEKHDISSLKVLASVGQSIDPPTWQWYRHHVGRDRCPILDTWWQTEAGGPMITPLPGTGCLKPGSCSLPFLGVDPVIIDPDTGEETRFPDQQGALFIRKPWPGMARTVFDDHERFREIYFGRFPGMFFTGNLARKDADGHYWIGPRVDEVINVSGYRVGPAEVESALNAHPEVVEAAVVAFPHSIKGDGIYAFVTLAAGCSKSEELRQGLMDLVRRRIGGMAVPDVIQWTHELPKTRSGKTLRQLLQKIASGDLEHLEEIASILSNPSLIDELIRDRMGLPRQ